MNALADGLFAHLRVDDYAGAAAYFAPDATWWRHGHLDGRVDELLPKLSQRKHPIGARRYDEVRRLFASDAVIEQHMTRWTDAAGKTQEMGLCVVLRLNADGLVSRLEEYYDTAALPRAAAPSALTAVTKVQQHVTAELANKVPEIVATVSDWDVHYALLSRMKRGLVLELVEDKAQARTYYDGTRSAYTIAGTHHLREVNTPWYAFHESTGVVTHVGDMDGVPPTGKNLYVPTAILFPVWTDGIIGEISWSRFDMAEIARGNARLTSPPPAPAPYLAAAELRNEQLHKAFVDAWRSGDLDLMLSLIDDECCTVVRTVELNGPRRTRTVARTKDELRRYYASAESFRPIDLRVTNLVVSDWYVFAQYLFTLALDGKRIVRDLAVLHPVTEDGKLVGQLAYGFDRPE